MKLTNFLKAFVFTGLLCAFVMALGACSDDDKSVALGTGTVVGLVTDDVGEPIAGATVTISSIGGSDGSVTTGSDGKYTFNNVTIASHAVTFSAEGYQTISTTITPAKFTEDKIATANMSLLKSVKIQGVITQADKDRTPLADVVVSVSTSNSVTTGADGKYVLDGLGINDYDVTFTKAGFLTITRKIAKSDFVDGMVVLDVQMGGVELLRGKTAVDLQNADKWFFSEYRGGRNADAYPHWDWACDYMCTLDFWGAWQEQNEGTTLQIRNTGKEQENPADMDVFDSYVYGSKSITADNKILSLRVRTHSADASSPAYFGVQVIDLSAAEPVTEKVGDTKTYGSGDYTDFHFDLSKYIGKEVIVAVGIYRKETGNYYKQLVLRRISFAQENVTDWNWIPGTEVVSGWKLTQEMVRSTMPHTRKSFTGISPKSGNRDNYVDAYRAWRDVGHIGATWSFVPLRKDPEVFPSEGYLIKTTGNGPIDTKVPESYFYAKFSVSEGQNKLTFKTRNFGSNYTFFKMTAIENNGTVTHLSPKSNTAKEASAAADGCWKFKHGEGGAGDPDKYASFVYDLSQFNGSDVTLVLGVYNGELNGDENKLVLYNIALN